VHRPVAIDIRNGLLATSDCPDEVIDVEHFTVLPPRFAAWAKQSGLKMPPVEYSALCSDIEAPKSRALAVTTPAHGSTVLIDPEIPRRMRTLRLDVTVDPPVPQIIWYVDGSPYKLTDYPYTTRWQMTPGKHTFQAVCASSGERSKRIKVNVVG